MALTPLPEQNSDHRSVPEILRRLALDPFPATVKEGGPSPVTYQRYLRDFQAYLEFAGSEERVLDPATLTRWISHLREGLQKRPGTVKRKATAVRQIMQLVSRQEGIDQAIAESVKKHWCLPMGNVEVRQWLIELCQATPGITGEELQVAYQAQFGGRIRTGYLNLLRAELRLDKPNLSRLTKEEIQWIDEQCREDLDITARDLQSRMLASCGKLASRGTFNRIRASLGLSRPNPHRSHEQHRPVSYKLDSNALRWLKDQCKQAPASTGQELATALNLHFGIKITSRAVNILRNKFGLSRSNGRVQPH